MMLFNKEKSNTHDDQVVFQEKDLKNVDPQDTEIPTFAGLSGNKLIFAITCAATSAFLLFGYDQGVMSGIITGREFIQAFPACDAAVQGEYKASVLQAFYTAIYEIGCLLGAIFALFYGNVLGRKRMIQAGAVIVILGTIIQVSSIPGHNAPVQFLIGRTITGVGVGFETSTVPSWQAETCKAHNRGLLICIEASMIAIGTMIAYWLDFGLSFYRSSFNWRFPIAFQVFFAVVLLIATAPMPESPRYLLSRNRKAEGQRVVAALAGFPVSHEETVLQTSTILDSIRQLEQNGSSGFKDLFTRGPTQHFRRALVGMSTQLFQQIGGCNAVIYFAPVIYEQNLGLSRTLSLILGGSTISLYACAAIGSYFLVERVGRRKLFLVGTVGQGLSMLIAFACLLPGSAQSARGSVFGIFFYLFWFGLTWLELPWLYPAEINPLATRTRANALSTISNWLFNFSVVQWSPPMFAALNAWGFFIFFIINVCFLPFIWFFYIETAGRKLEEIDVIFAKGYLENKGQYNYVRIANEMPHLGDQEIQDTAQELRVQHETSVDSTEERVIESAASSNPTLVAGPHEHQKLENHDA